MSKFPKVEAKKLFVCIFRQNGAPSEEYAFRMRHVTPDFTSFYISSPNDLVLPDALNKLRIFQTLFFKISKFCSVIFQNFVTLFFKISKFCSLTKSLKNFLEGDNLN